jgi:uncharacterized protein YdaU (DUF1376 family)
MAKDPAVLFYTSDFLTGTMLMSYEQKGKYITLLCLQHQKGILSEKDMLNICQSYDEDIFNKFQKTDEGFFNIRMKNEHEKRSNFSKSRSENRLKGIENKKVKQLKKKKISYDNHMENENENINDNIIINKSDLEIKLIEFYNFRKELKKPIVESSKEQFLQKLKTLSNNNESNAIKILNQSIANGWQGIFELKTIENGNKSAKLNGEQRDKELAEWKLFGKNNISKFNPEN